MILVRAFFKSPVVGDSKKSYNNPRQELFLTITSICQPTSNILLYGAEYLTYTENKQIFLAVQEFSIKSKRFEIT